MSKLTINSKIRMNSGYDIPILGYGVSRLTFPLKHIPSNAQTGLPNVRMPHFDRSLCSKEANHHLNRPHEICEEVVNHALKVGYRHVSFTIILDTSHTITDINRLIQQPPIATRSHVVSPSNTAAFPVQISSSQAKSHQKASATKRPRL